MTASKGNRLSTVIYSAITGPAAKSIPFAQATLKQFVGTVGEDADAASEADSPDRERFNQLTHEISSVLKGDNPTVPHKADHRRPLEKILKIPWISRLSNNIFEEHRKEVSRDRKQKWFFHHTQFSRIDQLVSRCAQKIGSDATLDLFGTLGRDTGLNEYKALIRICIQKAKISYDEEAALEEVYKAYKILETMKEKGFPLEESTYGPFLSYLVNMGWIEEFEFFCDLIRNENPSCRSKLGYYEMLLWLRVNNEEKIQELCKYITEHDDEDESDLGENYLLALCESDRKEELLQLLEIIDITKFSSVDHVSRIFKSLGKLSLESFAEKFLLKLKTHEKGASQVSNFIFYYASSITNLAMRNFSTSLWIQGSLHWYQSPNLPRGLNSDVDAFHLLSGIQKVENILLKFKDLHAKLEIKSSSSSLENLIIYCCNFSKVHMALDIVDEMCELGLSLPTDALHYIMRACDENYEYNLVWRIYSVVRDQNLTPNSEFFRSMIMLCVNMKDYDGAHRMLSDLKKMNLNPTVNIYNAIMAGYCREKDTHSALMVLKQMKNAGVEPDSQTFSLLISSCDCEEAIIKYYEEIKKNGIQPTKQVFMSLINAYANCGQFEKAKQVLLDKEIPPKFLDEFKSMLVSALAYNGQMADAFGIYDEIKKAGGIVDPKSLIALIGNVQDDGELPIMLILLEELKYTDHWVDGCCKTILYCVKHKHLRDAVDLLKQLKNNYFSGELDMETIFAEICAIIASAEPGHLKIGLDLLDVIKDEFGISPSRKCLDFLLNACIIAEDLQSAILIWKEYQQAGLPYNVISYVRMYQALLASGEREAADIFLRRIPLDDIHVRAIIKSYQAVYNHPVTSVGKKKKKKKTAKKNKQQT